MISGTETQILGYTPVVVFVPVFSAQPTPVQLASRYVGRWGGDSAEGGPEPRGGGGRKLGDPLSGGGGGSPEEHCTGEQCGRPRAASEPRPVSGLWIWGEVEAEEAEVEMVLPRLRTPGDRQTSVQGKESGKMRKVPTGPESVHRSPLPKQLPDGIREAQQGATARARCRSQGMGATAKECEWIVVERRKWGRRRAARMAFGTGSSGVVSARNLMGHENRLGFFPLMESEVSDPGRAQLHQGAGVITQRPGARSPRALTRRTE